MRTGRRAFRLPAALILVLAVTEAPAAAEKWPFFAMDTALGELGRLGTARELGYEGVGWRFEESQRLAASVARIRESGLKLFAVYGGATLTREGLRFQGDLDARLEAIADSGAVLWLPVNSPDFSPSDPGGDSVAVPELRRLADRAAASRLRIALYPHAGSWLGRVQDAVRIARQVGRENFGVTFNLCHCLRVGDEAKIPELLAEAAPHLFLVTVNGADRGAAGAPWERLIRPLDEGSFDLGTFLRQLESVGYTGPVGLQAFGIKLPPAENLGRSLRAWRSLVPVP